MPERTMNAPWLGAALLLTLGLVLLALAGRAVAQRTRPTGDAPTVTATTSAEAFGELEVVTHALPYRNAESGGTASTSTWTLRWKGQAFAIASRGGMFADVPTNEQRVNSVFVLGDGPAADLIVNVGDPNNTSAFHLLRQQSGTLQTPLICTALAGANTVGWIDGPQARQGTRNAFSGPQFRHLSGGRLLGLGSRCVYDARDRVAYELPKPPVEGTVLDRLGALGVSPDGRQVAYIHMLWTPEAERLSVLVADLQQTTWRSLPIDRNRMRYPDLEALDAAWLAHHFEWRRVRDDFRLAERTDFQPLPRRGFYLEGQAAEFRLAETLVGTRYKLAAFLKQRFGAVALAQAPAAPRDDTFVALSLRQHVVMASDIGVHVGAPFDVHAKGYWPGQLGDPALARQLVHEIGEAIDAELAAGRLQDLFATAAR
jgi:hypothetical protein